MVIVHLQSKPRVFWMEHMGNMQVLWYGQTWIMTGILM